MRPAAVLIAIVFGSATAIGFGLIATAVVFGILRSEHAELAREMRPLLIGCAWFVSLSAVSGAALFATLKGLRWRALAQLGMALCLIAVGVAYWPRR